MKQQRPKTPLEEQTRLIEEQRKSGLSISEWCEREGIPKGTFYGWLKQTREAKRSDIPEKQEIVPVRILDQKNEDTSVANTIAEVPVIELTMGMLHIRIPSGTDPTLAGAVISGLRGLVC